jgi:hypothetical protein
MHRWLIGLLVALVVLAVGCSSKAPSWAINVDSIRSAQVRTALPGSNGDRQDDQIDLTKLAAWLSAAQPLKKAPPAEPMHFSELLVQLRSGDTIHLRVALTCKSHSDGNGYACMQERDIVEATRGDWPGEWLRSPELFTFLSGPTSASAARPDVGYLRVLVRSGARGQNPAIPEADITIGQTGIQVKTDATGHSPSIQLPAPESHPVMQSHHIGYYTITVTYPGFKRHVIHTFVHGGSTEFNPTGVDVYLIPGEGEVIVTDSPVGGRNAPQTPGTSK